MTSLFCSTLFSEGLSFERLIDLDNLINISQFLRPDIGTKANDRIAKPELVTAESDFQLSSIMRFASSFIFFTWFLRTISALRSGFVGAYLLLVVGGTGSLGAVEVRPPPFAELVSAADYVVRARVASSRSDWEGAEPQRQIFSYFKLDVLEVLSGDVPEPLVLRMLGGKIGEERVSIEGVPELRVGVEYVLFVRGNERQFYPLVAMMHGMYPIVRDEASSAALVTRSNGLPLHSTNEVSQPMSRGGVVRVGQAAALPALTLEEFQSQIRLSATGTELDDSER